MPTSTTRLGPDDDFQEIATENDAIVYGGLGDDQLLVLSDNSTVYGGEGLVSPNDGDDFIYTSGFDGNFSDAAETSVVYGNAGDDGIYGFVSQTGYFDGGNDNDTIFVNGDGSADVTSYGGLGEDSIDIENADSVLVYGGRSLADTTDGDDTIQVGVDETIYGNTGVEDATIYGNAGDDSVDVAATGEIYANGGMGDDTINADGVGGFLSNTDIVVYGGVDSDEINVDDGGDVSVYGGSSASNPGDGADSITVSDSEDAAVYGNGDDDTISVDGDGSMAVYGGQGSDDIDVSYDGDATSDEDVLVFGGEDDDNISVNTTIGATVSGGANLDGTENVGDGTAGDTVNVNFIGEASNDDVDAQAVDENGLSVGDFQLTGSTDGDTITFSTTNEVSDDTTVTIDAGGGFGDSVSVLGLRIQTDNQGDFYVNNQEVSDASDNTFEVTSGTQSVTVTILNLDPTILDSDMSNEVPAGAANG